MECTEEFFLNLKKQMEFKPFILNQYLEEAIKNNNKLHIDWIISNHKDEISYSLTEIFQKILLQGNIELADNYYDPNFDKILLFQSLTLLVENNNIESFKWLSNKIDYNDDVSIIILFITSASVKNDDVYFLNYFYHKYREIIESNYNILLEAIIKSIEKNNKLIFNQIYEIIKNFDYFIKSNESFKYFCISQLEKGNNDNIKLLHKVNPSIFSYKNINEYLYRRDIEIDIEILKFFVDNLTIQQKQQFFWNDTNGYIYFIIEFGNLDLIKWIYNNTNPPRKKIKDILIKIFINSYENSYKNISQWTLDIMPEIINNLKTNADIFSIIPKNGDTNIFKWLISIVGEQDSYHDRNKKYFKGFINSYSNGFLELAQLQYKLLDIKKIDFKENISNLNQDILKFKNVNKEMLKWINNKFGKDLDLIDMTHTFTYSIINDIENAKWILQEHFDRINFENIDYIPILYDLIDNNNFTSLQLLLSKSPNIKKIKINTDYLYDCIVSCDNEDILNFLYDTFKFNNSKIISYCISYDDFCDEIDISITFMNLLLKRKPNIKLLDKLFLKTKNINIVKMLSNYSSKYGIEYDNHIIKKKFNN